MAAKKLGGRHTPLPGRLKFEDLDTIVRRSDQEASRVGRTKQSPRA
jgi:hypothetical protein